MKSHFPRWAATLGFLLASVFPAQATSFVVHSVADTDGPTCGTTDCTLRQAINAANSATGTNAISFDASIFASKQTITLANGVLPSIATNLTIQGPTASGAGVTVAGTNNGVSAGGGTPVFRITGGTVTIADLTASNGTVGVSARAGTVTVQRCTLSGNGSGLGVGTASVTAQNCTLFGNPRSGLFNNSGVAAIQNCSIISNGQGISAGSSTNISNTLEVGNGGDASTSSMDSSYNLLGGSAAEAGLQVDGNGNPILADNGGPAFTVALVTPGTAVDQGRSTLATDERGKARIVDFPYIANAARGNGADIGAFEAQDFVQSGNFFVNQTSDHDDGVCGVLDCTLREAINAANAKNGASDIRFDSVAFAAKQTITVTGGLPIIASNMSIIGPEDPGSGVTIKGGASDTIFNSPAYSFSISSVAITGGAVGIATRLGGLSVQRCTLSGNGDGIVTAISSGNIYITNCTFAGNTNSGVHCFGGSLNLENCTITRNGQGISTMTPAAGTSAPIVFLDNSIVAANPNGNLSAPLTDNGYNLTDGNGQGLLTAASDKLNTDPGLDPAGLRDNGGPIPTIALLPGSAAVNAGKSSIPTDARSKARPVGFPNVPNASGGNGADIGAFELNESPQSGPNFVVNAITDHDDGVCGPLDCTLREAIHAANAGGNPSVITFDTTVFSAPRKTIYVPDALLPAITTDLTITAPRAGVIVRDQAFNQTQLFTVSSGTVTLSNLTIHTQFMGVLTNGGAVTVRGCTIEGETPGNFKPPTAILNTGAALTIGDSTLTTSGVGVSTSGGTTTLQSCTIAGNATNLKSTGGTLSVASCIVALKTDSNVSNTGTFNDLGYNLCDDTGSGAFSAATDKVNANPKLGPLQDNGGPTTTLGLTMSSPAVDAGSSTFATDQRGVTRDSKPDIGAFEFNVPTVSIGNVSQLEGNSGTNNFDFTVTLSAFASSAVTVNYATSDGTATGGKDYIATSGTLSIPLGSTSGTISVPVISNTRFEMDKTFNLTISAPVGATLGSPSVGLGTIINDDPRPAVISQFRLSGPGGPSDEFIELASTTNITRKVNGWILTVGSVSIPLSGTLPAGGHLLITNSDGYSLGAIATGDVTFTGAIPTNSTLALTYANGTPIDTVGDLSATAAPITATDEYAYMRRLETGAPAKTASDTNDFNLVDSAATVGTLGTTGVGALTAARLGSPNPHNAASTIQRNAGVSNVPINISAVPSVARYSSKNSGVDTQGRLSIRRTIQNNTGAAATKLRFRITAITAGTSGTAGVADLRAISSGGVKYFDTGHMLRQGAIGITIDAPTTPTVAPLLPTSSGTGGGLNAGWTVPLPGGTLAAGATVNVEFLFGIKAHGKYRVAVDAELLP